jgi:L-malate glycosyltransferase
MENMIQEPIRIGFCVHKMQVAGAEVLIDRMIQHFGDSIAPSIFCLDAIGSIGEKLRDKGVPVVVLDRRPGIDWGLASRFAAAIESHRLEILHAHQYTPFFYSALAKRKCRGVRPKVYFTEHGRHYPDRVRWKRRLVNKYFLSRYADAICACSRFSAEAVSTIDGFPYCDVIWNGVPLDLFSMRGGLEAQGALRRKLGLEVDRPMVACVARFHPVKDHVTLLRAWAKVSREHPKAVLLLLGEGPERGNLESLVRENGNESSVRFLGARNDVQDFLHCVDVFALTSLSEASPLTLLEAMACGCSSVVTEVGGNPEHIDHGVEAFMAKRGDVDGIALHLGQLLGDASLRDRMGQAGRRRVESQFSLIDCMEKYGKVYEQLAGRRLGG